MRLPVRVEATPRAPRAENLAHLLKEVCKRSVLDRRRSKVRSWLAPWRVVLIGASAGLALFTSQVVHAEASDRVGYSQKQVYSAAVRYLRIELRYEITERDPDAAYLLFEYLPMGQKTPRFGAVEVVKLQQGVRLVVRLPDQPSYQESMLRDGLLKKLVSDYGDLPEPSRENPPVKPPDGPSKPAGDRTGTAEGARPNARP